MDRLFTALGRVTVRHRGTVVVVWLLLLAFGLAFAPRLGEVFERRFLTGGTGDSQTATEIVTREFPAGSAFVEQLVFTSDSLTVDDARYRDAAAAVIAAAAGTGRVKDAEGFLTNGDRGSVSRDGRTTYVALNLTSTTHSDAMTAAGKLLAAVAAAPRPGWLRAYVTGIEAVHANLISAGQESIGTAEAVGLPIALVVMVLVFGGLVAAGLPLVMGLVSILIVLGLAYVLGQAMDLSTFIENIATMLGLGLGIDYSLFMLTRYRSERGAGRDVGEAVVQAVRHAGKAIVISGLAVALGLVALLAAGEPNVSSMGIGGVLVTLVAVAAAVTLLPATVALLGDRIERPRRLSRLVRRVHRDGFWGRWARVVMRRPVGFLALGLAVIVVLAWPALTLRTGSAGVEVLNDDAQSRVGFEVLARGFGPGLTSPVQVVVRSPAGIDDPRTIEGIAELSAAIAADARFAGAVSITTLDPRLTLPQLQALYADRFAGVPTEQRGQLGRLVNLDRAGDTTIVLGLLNEDPGSDVALSAIRALRSEVIPSIPGLRGATVLVGGTSALELDSMDALYGRFPLIVGIILIATFLLLMVMFRSIVIPLTAVVMNLLSVLAAYGLLVLVFQDGLGERLLDFTAVGSIEWQTPVLLFAILFGLSMDYEVFLLSRIRELHDRGYGNAAAVAGGLERTGGVITGAALLMIVIFSSFILSPLVLMKELGFALAAAVLIDASLVRMILVPATMRLLGDWNWWLPGWLGRRLPTVELERVTVAVEAER